MFLIRSVYPPFPQTISQAEPHGPPASLGRLGSQSSTPRQGQALSQQLIMDHGTHLFRAICIAFAACVGTGVGNFAAFGHTAPPFRYDFGPETAPFPVSQDPGRTDNTLAIYPIPSDRGDSIASLADYAMSQQIDAQPGLYVIPGVAFGYDIPVDYPAGQLSLRQPSEPIVPEPSTIFGGIAAAGLMLVFLVRRWIQRRSSAPGT